jgi:hypothetical protein
MGTQTNRQTSFVVVVAAAAIILFHLTAADVVRDYQVIQRGEDNAGAYFVSLGAEMSRLNLARQNLRALTPHATHE